MKDKFYKVKRKHIHWNLVRLEIEDLRVDEAFFGLLAKHPKMSKDRVAWNALKRYYSTTALQRYRISGDIHELFSSDFSCGLRFRSVE